MAEAMVRQNCKEFGKDMGLIHETVVAARKLGADRSFWSKLAHDPDLFRQVLELVGEAPDRVYVDYGKTFEELVMDARVKDLEIKKFEPVGKNGYVAFREVRVSTPVIPCNTSSEEYITYCALAYKALAEDLARLGVRTPNLTEILTFMSTEGARDRSYLALAEEQSPDFVIYFGDDGDGVCVNGNDVATFMDGNSLGKRDTALLAVQLQ